MLGKKLFGENVRCSITFFFFFFRIQFFSRRVRKEKGRRQRKLHQITHFSQTYSSIHNYKSHSVAKSLEVNKYVNAITLENNRNGCFSPNVSLHKTNLRSEINFVPKIFIGTQKSIFFYSTSNIYLSYKDQLLALYILLDITQRAREIENEIIIPEAAHIILLV